MRSRCLLLLLPCIVNAIPFSRAIFKRQGVFEVPLTPSRSSSQHLKKRQQAGLQLGSYADLSYLIDIQFGGESTPVVFDTGSSDLITIVSACASPQCDVVEQQLPVYTASNATQLGLPFSITYGSETGGTLTSANGSIVLDSASVAGFSVQNQAIAAINVTDTLTNPGFTGVGGVSFPGLSSIVGQVLQAVSQNNFADPITDISATSNPLDILNAYGPITSRLVTQGLLERPMMSLILERDNILPSPYRSKVIFGGLPEGLTDADFVWQDVVLYRNTIFGDNGAALHWEIPIDGVTYLGSPVAAPTNLVGPLSALFDTGASAISVPQAVWSELPLIKQGGALPCGAMSLLSLSVTINGTSFPVSPLDMFQQVQTPGDTIPSGVCVGQFSSSDDPNEFFSYSYVMGSPFLRNVISAWYFGNITHPQFDKPRIGFRSIYNATEASAALSSLFPSATAGPPVQPLSSAVSEAPASLTTDNTFPTSF